MYVCMHACVLSHVQLFVTLWTVACQVPLSMGFSRQEYRSGFAISSSRWSFWPRHQTHISCISCIGRWIFTTEPPGKPLPQPLYWSRSPSFSLSPSCHLSPTYEDAVKRRPASSRDESPLSPRIKAVGPWSWTSCLQNCVGTLLCYLSYLFKGVVLWQPGQTEAGFRKCTESLGILSWV